MVVVFDFDKTLTYKDTLLGFFLCCSKNDYYLPIKLVILILIMFSNKLKLITNSEFKKISVRLMLKGKTKEFISTCSIEYSRRIKLNRVYYNTLVKYDQPFVITASFIDYICPLLIGTKVIGSELEYHNGRINGVRTNCYGKIKRKELKKVGITHIDELFTDSLSDLPLARISHVINLVKGDKIIKCKDIEHFIKITRK